MRSRIVRTSFFSNECLAECSAFARLLFIGLWCEADREGRFEWRPKRLKTLILPYDDVEIDSLLEELRVRNFVVRYVSNPAYGFIPNFLKHQSINKHEARSAIPAPMDADLCICINVPLYARGRTEQVHVPVQVPLEVEVHEGGTGGSRPQDIHSTWRRAEQPGPDSPPSDPTRRRKPAKAESPAPIYDGCVHFRISAHELVLAQEWYHRERRPPELLNYAIREVDLWLQKDTAGSIKARKAKSHKTYLYDIWVIEKALAAREIDSKSNGARPRRLSKFQEEMNMLNELQRSCEEEARHGKT